jgi:hypothetical protein
LGNAALFFLLAGIQVCGFIVLKTKVALLQLGVYLSFCGLLHLMKTLCDLFILP